MKLTHRDIRERFKKFYEETEHKEVPAISLIPNDATTLFTGSGMQQFVPNLLGEPHPQGTKLFNIQPCFRAQDIEEVGDNRHTTFFEMIGNWSLGDYFKEEQLTRLYNFLIDEKTGLGLPKEKLYITVFEGYKTIPKDEESYQIWKKLGVPDERIRFYGPEKNWWSRAGTPDNMPPGEPGGPDSEVFYDFGKELKIHENSSFKDKPCHPNCDCGRFIEICNSVFMEYQKQSDESFKELPKKNVDFGGGLERFLMAVQDKTDVYEIDIFNDLYQQLRKKIVTQPTSNLRRLRIFLDHTRGIIFLIAAGVKPGKNEREYILRRLIRRADNHLSFIPVNKREIWKITVNHFIEKYQDIYTFDPNTFSVIDEELIKFQDVFEHIGSLTDKYDSLLVKDFMNDPQYMSTASGTAGTVAFNYASSFGVPYEISKGIAQDKGLYSHNFDKKYSEGEKKHKNLSRTSSAGMFKGGLADHSEQVLKYHTATHLLHQALFDVLGNDVKQEGSNITGERLRFDFSASRKPTEEDKNKINVIINEKIKESLPVQFEIMSKEKAYEVGAKSFFREKYPDNVKVYFIGNDLKSAYSKEFCGGPHVQNTKEIGAIQLYKIEKIGSNMYRVYAK